MALLERRKTVHADICSMLPDLELEAVYWCNSPCPVCKDDHDFFFVIDREYYSVKEDGHVVGGYCCTSCGFSNAGTIHRSDLPDGYKNDFLSQADK